ncbi:MAG: hypothetical protein ACJA0Y_001484 [Maricaulis maris]|jgi:hypothetical protein
MMTSIKSVRTGALALFVSLGAGGAALAEGSPAGQAFFWELVDTSATIGQHYTFEPDGSVTQQTTYIFNDGRPEQDVGPSYVAGWSQDGDGGVTVEWADEPSQHCAAWPAYTQGPVDAVPDGDCWLSEQIRNLIREGAVGGYDG